MRKATREDPPGEYGYPKSARTAFRLIWMGCGTQPNMISCATRRDGSARPSPMRCPRAASLLFSFRETEDPTE